MVASDAAEGSRKGPVMVLPKECVTTGAALPHPGALPQVMNNAAGYYIGYRDTDGGPYSRESGYYSSYGEALQAWKDGVASWRSEVGIRFPGDWFDVPNHADFGALAQFLAMDGDEELSVSEALHFKILLESADPVEVGDDQ